MGSEGTNLQTATPDVGGQPGQVDQVAPETVAVDQPGEDVRTETPEAVSPTETVDTTAKPKTYTEKDVEAVARHVQSQRDREIQQQQAIIQQLAMKQHIQQLAAQEQAAQQRDKQAVDSGTITQEDAQARARARYEDYQLKQTIAAQEQHGEQLGRVTAAYDLGVKHGIDPMILMSDPNIRTYTQMVERAAEIGNFLAQKRIKDLEQTIKAKQIPSETYDRGSPQSSGGGRTSFTRKQIEDMSPEDFKANRDAIDRAYQAGRIK